LFSITVSRFDFCEIELWSSCRVVEGLQMQEKNQDVMTDQVDIDGNDDNAAILAG
jgi:hypothetical protein